VQARANEQSKTALAQTLILVIWLLGCVNVHSADKMDKTVAADSWSLLVTKEHVADPYEFFGLAAFYSEIRVDLIATDSIRPADREGEPKTLGNEWLGVSGRYDAHAILAPGLDYRVTDEGLWVKSRTALTEPGVVSIQSSKTELYETAPELKALRYAHLWNWLGALAKLVEASLIFIQAHIVSNWGLAIAVLALVIKVLLLPVSILTARLQLRVSSVQARLLPELAEIKAAYDGEEAHERIMAAHGKQGVSPFYTLKPMLGTLIQVPVLIAVFNALGEMPALRESSFLWIGDLAYPDAIAPLGFSIPLLGNKLSLLPFCMTAVTVWATLTLRRELLSKAQLGAEKRRMLMMAGGFFLLFYPFPAAMVFYWTCTNLFQLPLQRLLKT